MLYYPDIHFSTGNEPQSRLPCKVVAFNNFFHPIFISRGNEAFGFARGWGCWPEGIEEEDFGEWLHEIVTLVYVANLINRIKVWFDWLLSNIYFQFQ